MGREAMGRLIGREMIGREPRRGWRRAWRRVPWGYDDGAGSVLLLAVGAVLVVLAVALGLVVQAAVARSRAQAVADLSALAAARVAQRAAVGMVTVEPCACASEVASRNGGALVSCRVEGAGVVVVESSVTTYVGVTRATARAGPRGP